MLLGQKRITYFELVVPDDLVSVSVSLDLSHDASRPAANPQVVLGS